MADAEPGIGNVGIELDGRGERHERRGLRKNAGTGHVAHPLRVREHRTHLAARQVRPATGAVPRPAPDLAHAGHVDDACGRRTDAVPLDVLSPRAAARCPFATR